MSTTEKSQKSTNNSLLKSELNQLAKVVHGLLNGIEKKEATLVAADKAVDVENSYREKLSKQAREIDDLQDDLQKLNIKNGEEVTSFATANLKLNENFHARLRKQNAEYQSKLEEGQQREATNERKWQDALRVQKGQVNHFREGQEADRRQLETKLKQVEQGAQLQEVTFQKKLQEAEAKFTSLSERYQTLEEELSKWQKIQEGRQAEVDMLTRKIDALEAFPTKSKEKVISLFAGLQVKLHDFCIGCVKSAQILPTWNEFSEDVRPEGLPRHYYKNSKAGCYVLCSAIEHSLCAAMVENIFVSFSLNACQELDYISKALYRSNPSHEAIWRLTAANATLGDRQMLAFSQQNFRKVADRLLTKWKLFRSNDAMDKFVNMLSKLLFDAFEIWIGFMKYQDKIQVSIDGESRYFEPDSGERTIEVPGNFAAPKAKPPLCLFPALLEVTFGDRKQQRQVLRKGTMMYSNSPSLLLALKEEEQMDSPGLTNKEFPKSAGSISSST